MFSVSTSWPLLSIDSVILVNNNLQIQDFFLIPVVALDHYADWPIRIDIINHFIAFDSLTSRVVYVVYSKPPKIIMSPRFRDHFNPGNFLFQPSIFGESFFHDSPFCPTKRKPGKRAGRAATRVSEWTSTTCVGTAARNYGHTGVIIIRT